MRYIADLHIHSKYSRACSKDLDLEHNYHWARKKGIQIVGTGDFTHPFWFKELKEKLVEARPGLFRFAYNLTPSNSLLNKGEDSLNNPYFMLTTELSCIYKQGDKVRRIHLCVFAPDLKTVEKINQALQQRKVNLSSDGRPIMGLSSLELTKIILDINPQSMVVPAHAWTPWFSVFGSKSGFDSLEECFGDLTKEIFAIETGLSSDPSMNWRLSALDDITLISNSDAHSPANLGREANVFDIPDGEVSYVEIRRILQEKDRTRFLYTIEFFPEEGKYHYDGHRDCDVNFKPADTKKHQGICPKCKKPLTIGVLNRVEELADRAEGFTPDQAIPYKNLVPLTEIIAEALGVGKGSKKVQALYEDMVQRGGSEFSLLLDQPYEQLAAIALPEVVQGIKNVRKQQVQPTAGYDGVYGIIKTLQVEQSTADRQAKLL